MSSKPVLSSQHPSFLLDLFIKPNKPELQCPIWPDHIIIDDVKNSLCSTFLVLKNEIIFFFASPNPHFNIFFYQAKSWPFHLFHSLQIYFISHICGMLWIFQKHFPISHIFDHYYNLLWMGNPKLRASMRALEQSFWLWIQRLFFPLFLFWTRNQSFQSRFLHFPCPSPFPISVWE